MSTSERVRLRELAKYYSVANIKAKFPRRAPNTHDKIHQNIIDIDDLREIKAQPAADKQLTALAQLATHKLGFQRCFISIIDDVYQHFIAEATKSTSLGLNALEKQQDLMIGVQSVLLEQKWLPTTYTLQQGYFNLSLQEGQGTLEKDGMMVHDLASHSASEQSNLLKAFPEAFRAYMEVPLLTSTGYVFGSICVVDSNARSSSEAGLKQLREIAYLIVDHLDTFRLKADYGRAQRLLEGLAHFINGKQSLSAWSGRTAGQDFIPLVEAGVHDLSSIEPRSTLSGPKEGTSISLSSAELSLERSESRTQDPQYVTPATSEATDPLNVPNHQLEQQAAAEPVPTITNEDAIHQNPSTTTSAVAEAFSRASNLIRECMSLEATCFLEVPHNVRAQLGDQRGRRDKIHIEEDLTHSAESSYESSTPEERPLKVPEEVMCHRIAFSTRSKSSVARSYTTKKYLSIPANTLKTLASKYPRGRIFHFDVRGSVSSGEESMDQVSGPAEPGEGSSRGKKIRTSQRLSQLFPDAQSLVFVPMYDSDRQHIFAGFIGWTTSTIRAIQQHEVTFIKSFVDSVMCEVQRLEAISTDKAKSDFIASISHELRTPLHGILASAQLLFEGKKFEHQSEFLTIIDSCGRTLLDVMDHLLDHAKINHFTQRDKFKKISSYRRPKDKQSQSYSLVSLVDLAAIVEETAASVAASSNQLLRRRRELSPASGVFSPFDSNVSPIPIILDIEKQQRWSFQTESGSWRRIVMNLIGNSLKYTKHGHVSVKLSSTKINTTKALLESYAVELKVTDTGQGISEEYLKRRLFTAFAQEDNLSAGTGLGLSLVNDIVSTLDGKIEVHSEIGQGTEILIRIPVTTSPEDPAMQNPNTQTMSSFIGLKVTISGFAEAPSSPTGMPDPHATALLALRQSLTAMVTDWFQMVVVQVDPEVHIVEHSYLETHRKEYDDKSRSIIVVSTAGLQNLDIEMRRARFVCLAAPIGPARFAQALRTLLDMDVPSPEPAADQLSTLPTAAQIHSRKTSHPTDQIPTTDIADTSDGKEATPRKFQRRSSSSNTVVLASPQPQANESESRPTILLVDDNDINLRVLFTFVQRLKTHDILTAVNGEEAVAKFISSVENGKIISTIIMDINMPIMDGFEATRQIRQYESSYRRSDETATIIMALTGLGSEDSQSRIESCGFDHYMRKPVSLKQLREILSS